MSGFLVINPRSGKGRPDASELRAEAERLGITTHVLAADDDPPSLRAQRTGLWESPAATARWPG